jgi:hypothetical protein
MQDRMQLKKSGENEAESMKLDSRFFRSNNLIF